MEFVIGAIVLFIAWSFIKAKARIHYANERQAQRDRNATAVNPTLNELMQAITNKINGHIRDTGAKPKMMLIDINVHMLFAQNNAYSAAIFDGIETVPAANIDGGLTWKILS
ncbi:hypothetical protein ACSTEF_22005 [Vibrio vulnificus]|uniref:hypothetical protein n=1 Tax=Vibrio vulnificus TaxID=672 RepID=UPI003ED9B1CF